MTLSSLRFLLLPVAVLAVLAACSASLPSGAQIDSATPSVLDSLRVRLEARLSAEPDNPELQHLMGLTLLRSGKLEEAEAHALRATAKRPFDAEMMESLGRIYLAQDRRFRAVTAFSHALRMDAALLSAYVNMGIAHALLGQRNEAIASLREAIRRQRNYYPAQYRLGRLLLEKALREPRRRQREGRKTGAATTVRELKKAAESLQRDPPLVEAAHAAAVARRIRPNVLEAQLLEIRIRLAEGRIAVAKFLVDQALRARPDSLPLRRELVDIHMQRQEWGKALGALKRMDLGSGLEPADGLRMVEIYRAQGKSREAARLLDELLRRHPDHAGALLASGITLLAQNKARAALPRLKAALEHAPKLADAYFWKAAAHFRLGEIIQGNATLAIAEHQAPAHPGVRRLKIRRLLAARNTRAAAPLLEDFLLEFPADGNALLIKSELQTLIGNYAGAERTLEKLEPGASAGALAFARARLAYLRGEFRGVLTHTGPLLAKREAPWQVAYLHAAALGRLGRFAEAVKLLRPRLAGPEGSAAMHRLSGDLHHMAGNNREAEKTYVAGLSKFARHPGLTEGVSRLAIEGEHWAQARDWLEAGIERPSAKRALLLERLALVYRKLGDARKAKKYLGRYLAESDPLLGEQRDGSGEGVLFGTPYTAVGYKIRKPPLAGTPAAVRAAR